jgi:hypothetical protein
MAGRDPAFDLMELAGKRPEYQQMMDYLMSRRSVPPVQLNYLGGNVAGVFEYPGVTVTSRTPSGPNGRITVDDYRGVSTLVHETAHATQRQLAHQYGEEKYGPWMSTLPATPFTDAYDKMRLHKGPGTANPLEVLAPKWKQAEADYRSTSKKHRHSASLIVLCQNKRISRARRMWMQRLPLNSSSFWI